MTDSSTVPRTPQAEVYRITDYSRSKAPYAFSRAELDRLLSLYSRHVISGEWKAYAMNFEPGSARFSIFAHARAKPIFMIVKFRKPTQKNRRFSVFQGERKIGQADDIDGVLAVFNRKLKVVSS